MKAALILGALALTLVGLGGALALFLVGWSPADLHGACLQVTEHTQLCLGPVAD